MCNVCLCLYMCVYYVVVKKVLYLSKSTGARTFRSPFFSKLSFCVILYTDDVFLMRYIYVSSSSSYLQRVVQKGFCCLLLLLLVLLMMSGGGCLQHMMMMAIACI